jgi:ABC-type lipoprotein release transport system permease subunit
VPPTIECVEGRLYGQSNRNELVMGCDLARRLNLKVGSLLPPFYQSQSGEHVSEIVGIFRENASIGQSNLIVTSFATAQRIFDRPGLATDLLVHCQPGYQEDVRKAIDRMPREANQGRLQITTREELAARLLEEPDRREGTLTLLSVIAFAVAVLVVLVTTGFGLGERRREVAILKALGWQTDELLFRSLVESLTLGILAASLSVVIAFIWMEWFNGYGIAGVFLAEVEVSPQIDVPFRLLPGPVLLMALMSLIVVSVGSLHSTWRSAIAPPREAMR